MRKHFTIIFLALLCANAMAYDFSAVCSTGQTLYYNITSNVEPYTVEVTRENTSYPYYNTYPEGNLEIPETVEYNGITYSITSIGNGAFYACREITSLSIPNSITDIGQEAFRYCEGLTGELTIPNSVTNIYNNAFSDCENISSVIIGNGITIIYQGVFFGCTRMTYISISNSVTTIVRGAFNGCYGLTSVTIPNTVTSIGESAFGGVRNIEYNGTATGSPWGALTVNGYIDGNLVYTDETRTNLTGCSTLTTDVEIPNSVTSIGDYAFYRCDSLSSITIPNSVTSIGNRVFSYCSGLEVFSVEPDNTIYDSRNNCNAIIETETNSLIYGCKNTIIPNSITSIGDYAFFYSGLTGTLIIHDSITNIGQGAFWGCSDIETITIGLMVETINGDAFYSCSNITDINVRTYTPPVLGVDAFRESTYTDAKVWCTCGTVDVYINNSDWGQFSNIRNDTTALFNIVVQTAEYDMGSATGSGTFSCEMEQTIMAIPNDGFRFLSWNDGNTDNPRTVIVTSDSTFTAGFRAVYSVTVQSSNESYGSVSGDGTYDEGTQVVITATPYEGYQFVQWDDGNAENPRTITVTSDSTFIALFEEVPSYTITVLSNNDSYGSVSGGGTYYEGDIATLTAMPYDGYCFTSWDDDNTDNPRTITVSSDSTFIANFSEPILFTIDTTVNNFVTVGDHTFYSTGNYSFTIPTETGCDTIFNIRLRVLAEPEPFDIEPNPAKSILNIHSDGFISRVEFYSPTGQLVMRKEING
ncbi:MAG: leucine-rich repeat protein, partial [Bacteroidales bacterium]|nr:leucine-rich repeat protein [Bacteroidales bacterium]